MKQKPMLVALVATTAIALCCAAGLAYTVHSIRQYEKKNSVSSFPLSVQRSGSR